MVKKSMVASQAIMLNKQIEKTNIALVWYVYYLCTVIFYLEPQVYWKATEKRLIIFYCTVQYIQIDDRKKVK